jgi:SAM-dependent methyltransferase
MNGPNTFTGLHASYYDLVYAEKPYDQEVAWLVERLAAHGARGGALLDVACGSGRHASLFADSGWDVTGIDLNSDLLDHARDRDPRIEFVQADMMQLDLDRRFDAVTCLFDSIGYPQTDAGVTAALGGLARHLTPDGVAAYEFLHAPALISSAAPVRVRRFDTDEGGTLIRVSETRLDLERSVMQVDYELIELAPDGTYRRSTERQSNRFFTVEEMRALSDTAGLEPLEFLPAYGRGEVGANTFHVVCLARARR